MLRIFAPRQDFATFRREIDRSLESFLRPAGARGDFLPARNPREYPLVNVAEDADNVYIEALAPGLDAEKLQITVLRNQVTIAGEKVSASADVKAESYHRSERAAGRFTRTFQLPSETDEAKVAAEYRNGVLTITLPKSEGAKPRQIAVNVA